MGVGFHGVRILLLVTVSMLVLFGCKRSEEGDTYAVQDERSMSEGSVGQLPASLPPATPKRDDPTIGGDFLKIFLSFNREVSQCGLNQDCIAGVSASYHTAEKHKIDTDMLNSGDPEQVRGMYRMIARNAKQIADDGSIYVEAEDADGPNATVVTFRSKSRPEWSTMLRFTLMNGRWIVAG
ncbi:MAG: hypothetical protein KDD70_09855 [Bdellovibrionales bacterium]|nr:hypothetical protein [Bdellovibrionales bacterium]